MEPHIFEICTYQESVKEMWDYLQETYDQNKKIPHLQRQARINSNQARQSLKW
jgi:hypothetical protein